MFVQMNVRINNRILEKIKTVSELRGEQTSDFVRVAIAEKLAKLGFLSIKESKALGIDVN
jgi:hypothetical protein